MPQLTFDNQQFLCEDNESVLDCLLRHKQEIPHSCRKGTCHTCYLKAESGEVPETAQRGLKDTEVARGMFLACSCIPSTDMALSLPDLSSTQYQARVKDKTISDADVILLRLERPEGFEYRAGQFINIFRDATTVRSYSLASLPEQDDFLELHIKAIPDGKLSGWIKDTVQPGDGVSISGALGNSFYLEGREDQSMLLIGTGTGLAPLIGVARDALSQGHSGEIFLYHGSRGVAGLYMDEELRQMDSEVANFHYIGCVSGEEQTGYEYGRANDIALAHHPEIKNWRVFLCGNPKMVESAKMKFYLAGASLNDILTDPFTPAD